LKLNDLGIFDKRLDSDKDRRKAEGYHCGGGIPIIHSRAMPDMLDGGAPSGEKIKGPAKLKATIHTYLLHGVGDVQQREWHKDALLECHSRNFANGSLGLHRLQGKGEGEDHLSPIKVLKIWYFVQ